MSFSLQTVLVVPCYNEARRLRVSEFEAATKRRSWLSILFVDDGSSDDTWKTLSEIKSTNPDQFNALRLPQNEGKAEAVRHGLIEAMATGAEVVGFWDADLATPIDEVDALSEILIDKEVVMVMGARMPLLGRNIVRSPSRRRLSSVFTGCTRIALGLGVNDTQCGSKLFRNNEIMGQLFSKRFNSRWIFDVEIIARILEYDKIHGTDIAHHGIVEHPLVCWEDVDGSRLKPWDYMTASCELVSIAASLRRKLAHK